VVSWGDATRLGIAGRPELTFEVVDGLDVAHSRDWGWLGSRERLRTIVGSLGDAIGFGCGCTHGYSDAVKEHDTLRDKLGGEFWTKQANTGRALRECAGFDAAPESSRCQSEAQLFSGPNSIGVEERHDNDVRVLDEIVRVGRRGKPRHRCRSMAVAIMAALPELTFEVVDGLDVAHSRDWGWLGSRERARHFTNLVNGGGCDSCHAAADAVDEDEAPKHERRSSIIIEFHDGFRRQPLPRVEDNVRSDGTVLHGFEMLDQMLRCLDTSRNAVPL
jgi:hypothetical protein